MASFSATQPNMDLFTSSTSLQMQLSAMYGDDQNTTNTSPSWTGGGSPNDTDGSDFYSCSPPASDDGFAPTHAHPLTDATTTNGMRGGAGGSGGGGPTDDWDLLSEMLIDDAVNSMQDPTTLGFHNMYGAPNGSMTKQPEQVVYVAPPQYAPPPQYFQQQQLQQMPFQQNCSPPPPPPFQQQHRAPPSSSMTGFMDALLMQDDANLGTMLPSSPVKRNAVGSPQTTDLFPSVAMPPLPSSSSSRTSSCSSESESLYSSPLQSPQATHTKKPRTISAKSAATSSSSMGSPNVKTETLSADDAKKLRRRSQIASSVQRHREKKKCHVASLKEDLSSLTAHLATLRAQRHARHGTQQLVACEEDAITQRRKRKQSEDLNQRLKKALFQQTTFLMGFHGIMTNIPAPREMHIHDWLHSYTVLSGTRDQMARRKEYATHFGQSKMDMARQIVMRETDVFAPQLDGTKTPYFTEIRVLHDGTEVLHDERDVVVKKELQEDVEYIVPGNGQVVKKYTSMFLFEERGACTMEAFTRVALEATKSVGVFWPSPGYTSHALDAMAMEDTEDTEEEELPWHGSQLIFTDLHGSMALIDGHHGHDTSASDQDVQLEARMLCRIQTTLTGSLIVWDYADKDELYPMGHNKTQQNVIRRDSCGAAVVKREPGGKISFRSVCVKIFGPMETMDMDDTESHVVRQRRISLQASETERANQKCTRQVYESLASAFLISS